MKIYVTEPIFQTLLFAAIFLPTLVFFSSRKQNQNIFPNSLTDELKGLSILAIVFSHIGYFLSTNTQFLFPFSILGGVGVNLFLFLSGLGLTLSQIKNSYPILIFYKKRLVNLLIPLWITITLFLILDLFLLKRTYPLSEIIGNFLGFFPRADLTISLNSPLWFISPILFYYLIFPLLWIKKSPLISSLLVLITGYLVVNQNLPVHLDTLTLYKLHFWAFPLGMAFASILNIPAITSFIYKKILSKTYLKVILLIPLLLFFSYFAYHSKVGDPNLKLEQLTSLITLGAAVLIFILKDFTFKLLSIFGIFSYEIYLLHWPILSRYEFLYKNLPPFLATILYLVLFLGIAYLLQKFVNIIRRAN